MLVATQGDLSSERVRGWVDDAGVWAPVAFVLISAALTVAFFPGPLLAGASGLLFGTAAGFPLSLCAAVLGASAAFLIARAAGREPVERLAGPRVRALPPRRSAPPRARSPTRRSAARSTTSAHPRRSSPSSSSW